MSAFLDAALGPVLIIFGSVGLIIVAVIGLIVYGTVRLIKRAARRRRENENTFDDR